MSYTSQTERNISIKKLLGKAQTSNDKGLPNEALPSGLSLTSETIFGETIPTSSISSSLYNITNDVVEIVRLSASYIAGTDTSDGRHGFSLSLPSTYEASSSNPKAGTAPFVNNQILYSSNGGVQLIPTSFASDYEGVPYYGASGSLTQIPVLDARDWYLDYFNGIFFQQDPPGTGDHANNPTFIDAYIYIGSYLDTLITSGSNVISGITNAAATRVVTFSGATTLNGEANLTFDGSTLNIQGGVIHKRATTTSTLTASVSDYLIGVSASTNIIVQLPDAADLTSGQTFIIKDEAGNAGTYSIQIAASSSQTIDGANFVTLESPYAAINVYTNGTDKFFIY